MIGRISGQLGYRGADHVIVDVQGVGYVVHVSDRVLAGLPRPGEAVALWTDLLVREDLLQLFGFPTLVEKEWHRLLMSVQGVGAKASLAILSVLGPEGVSRAIALGDWSGIARAKGVGPKTAQRVVNELRDKAPAVMAMAGQEPAVALAATAGEAAETPRSVPGPQPGAGQSPSEALSALANLGYAPGEAAAAVAQAQAAEPEAQTASLIRASLRLLAPKG